MRLPFTPAQFFDVFRQYNEAVWPAQWFLAALAVAALLLAFRGTERSSRVIAVILALLWMWMGIVYHLAFFASINPIARAFGALFVVEAGMLLWMGAWQTTLAIRAPSGVRGVIGGLVITYALIVYPLLGAALGHRYPAAPTFGLPCPTTLFTLGLLMWAVPRAPRPALVIPILWAVVGTSAALQLGVWEDVGLAVAAVLTLTLEYLGGRHDQPLNDERARGTLAGES